MPVLLVRHLRKVDVFIKRMLVDKFYVLVALNLRCWLLVNKSAMYSGFFNVCHFS